MTISEAITRLDLQKQNTCTRQEKLNWLSELDGLIKTQILDAYENPPAVLLPYGDSPEENTVLLAEPPYDSMYLWYLEAKIDYQNGEVIRFNNAMELFQALFREYAARYHREHRIPGGTYFH